MKALELPPISIHLPGLDAVRLPPMVRIRQHYETDAILDPTGHLTVALRQFLAERPSVQGQRIAITVGSRGIPSLAGLVRSMVQALQAAGATPFIVPAMGSHGGGTAEGQCAVLAGYGVTEAHVGAPIRASMAVVEVARLEDGTPIYIDREAAEADAILLFNKIKPHTDFRGPHESGLAKMLAIGLANHEGASAFHRAGFARFAERIPQVAARVLGACRFLGAVGLVQNAYDAISELEVIPPEAILERDRALLEIAKRRIPRFKDPHLDLLVIDQIGKNISGNGHDPNITGRSNSPGFEEALQLQKLYIRGLSPESHHNGAGINWADLSLRSTLESIDWAATWTNVATVNILAAGKMPLYVENDAEAIRLALRTCVDIEPQQARIARIRDTLHMGELEVSLPYWEAIKHRADVEWMAGPYPWSFDAEGRLPDLQLGEES